jgi:hypothetical protein
MYASFFKSRPANQSTEGRMSFNEWVRQIHRWLAIVFTLTVIANLAAMTQGPPPMWVVYSPLPPLFLMLATGLYMFALPYMARRRKAQEKVQ